jgi:hypothetical protein
MLGFRLKTMKKKPLNGRKAALLILATDHQGWTTANIKGAEVCRCPLFQKNGVNHR